MQCLLGTQRNNGNTKSRRERNKTMLFYILETDMIAL